MILGMAKMIPERAERSSVLEGGDMILGTAEMILEGAERSSVLDGGEGAKRWGHLIDICIEGRC